MMETKYLWDRIDALRDALKDMKEENDALDSSLKESVNDYEKLQKENNHLELRVEELDGFSDDVDVKRSRAEVEKHNLHSEIDGLNAKVNRLNVELRTQKKEHIRSAKGRVDVIKELQVEVETLKADNKRLKMFDDVIIYQENMDELKAEIETLKDEAVKWNRKHNKLQESIINYKKPTFH